jgi:hypothetical protein
VLHLLAVLAAEKKTLWDPTILGVLTVLSGVVLFCGSVYLLLATNLGARLGFLISVAALTGLLTLLSALWLTTSTPLNSPKGRIASWIPISCPKSTPTCADVADLHDASISQFVQLANDTKMQTGNALPVANYTQLRPGFEAALVKKTVIGNAAVPVQPYAKVDATTSNLLLTKVFDFAGDAVDKEALLADAKKANKTAEVAKLEGEIAADQAAAKAPATRQLRAYQFGGGPKLLFWHDPFYSAVEYCPAVKPSTDPNVTPNPKGLFCDPAAGTRWFLMRYDYGSTRLPPLFYLLFSGLLFAVSLYALHTRELAQRRAARAGGAVTSPPVVA